MTSPDNSFDKLDAGALVSVRVTSGPLLHLDGRHQLLGHALEDVFVQVGSQSVLNIAADREGGVSDNSSVVCN
jgi:hypothetical protein